MLVAEIHSEGFEQQVRNWIHGTQHHYDLNLSPFGGPWYTLIHLGAPPLHYIYTNELKIVRAAATTPKPSKNISNNTSICLFYISSKYSNYDSTKIV